MLTQALVSARLDLTVEQSKQPDDWAWGRLHQLRLEHPVLGRLRTIGAPFKLPESPGGPRQPAPLLGQHNADVYGELLEIGATDIEKLKKHRII